MNKPNGGWPASIAPHNPNTMLGSSRTFNYAGARPESLEAAQRFAHAIEDRLGMYRLGPFGVDMAGGLYWDTCGLGYRLGFSFPDAATVAYSRMWPGEGWGDYRQDEGTFPASDIDRAVELFEWFEAGWRWELQFVEWRTGGASP